MGQMKTTAFVVVGCFARADCPHGRPDQKPDRAARSEKDLPVSAVTAVPLSEIVQTCVQTFIPLAESKNKV